MPGFKHRIYLDYASATPIVPEARAAMREAEIIFANPGSIHADGAAAKRLLEASREKIARELGCKAWQVVFTSGLTESNNLSILGFARRLEQQKQQGGTLTQTHWIASSIEHSSVLDAFGEIERRGGEVSFVDPDEKGIVRWERAKNALRPHTVFVSVGWANNEIGTIQPLSAIAKAIRAHEKKHRTAVIFHSDAGQAPLYEPAVVHSLGADLLSLGAPKLYGPHGAGALFVSRRTDLAPILAGGGQERGLRAGTENVALAAGFAAAFETVAGERHAESKRLRALRDDFARELLARIPGAIVNGDLKRALPHMLNISIPGEKTGEYLALELDRAGVALSTKSACGEGQKESHVVAALGGPAWRAQHTLRFSLGRGTAARDLSRVARILAAAAGA